MTTPRILFYDIEATNLNANFGYTLCVGYKFLGEQKAHIISIDDYRSAFLKHRTDDRHVLEAFGDVVAQADLCVYQYGMRYDEPFLNTRRLIKGLAPMAPVCHVDTWKVAREMLKMTSNRLETMIQTFGIAEKKTPLSGPIWIDAAAGYSSAIKYVKKHCYQDVLALELVYKKIRVMSGRWHPYMPFMSGEQEFGCQFCGSKKLSLDHGHFIYSKQSKRVRYQCRSCGGWTPGSIAARYRL